MSIPYQLILLRALCALGIPICAWRLDQPGIAIVILAWIGLLSDIFDGVVARRTGIATALLRRMDSQVDAVFWLSILGTACALHAEGLAHHAAWIAALLVLEMLIYGINFARFRRSGSTHAYSAKVFGLSLLAGFTEVFLTGAAQGWFQTMLIVGTIAQLEGVAIACMLSRWEHDVKSVFHVCKSRHRDGQTVIR